MAINKKITMDNGVAVNYHRIVSVNKITNHATVLEVASYTNKTARQKEKAALENGTPMDIFIHTEYVEMEYDENATIGQMYEHLGSLERFQGGGEV